MMHCPNCGTTALEDQRFCRSCGLSLEDFSRLLAERLPTRRTEPQNQKSKLEKVGIALLFGAAAVVYFSFVCGVVATMIVGRGEVVFGTMIVAIMTAVVLGTLLLSFSSSTKKSKSRPSTQPVELPDPESAAELPSGTPSRLVLSVTERTTELMEGAALERAERRRDSELPS